MRGVKTKAKARWKKLIIFGVLTLVFGILLNSVHGVYKKKRAAEAALSRMQEETKVLKKRENVLKESIRKLSTPEGIEFEIRRKLNVAEAGESVAIIVEEGENTSPDKQNKTPWQKFKNFLRALFD